ncbi:50S ribosomal protein L4 [Owenweeksia hongkongensis]|uniref:Large ribosomal subunit protein uL4 n=1 Tax=Owenweeksia hongkongensis (strain DSM 17368 / CIP 108786 / JCM 12287 / NRRL B-23963 / UST20020801) TaxID=926562 RepID=G8R2K3_OWEHD|nr:50S ribosomal protein L4 [Owenweeksia hongkongensis]AEV34015.1 50S ribosomal protein L4, bacterial/organelle [Owenweeksia hongkongensis DSM 17368]
MELAVLNKEGKETGRKVTLSTELYAVEPNHHAIYLDVKQYLANQRQGTHKSKERGEISRTTKKFFRQKGTGNARVGSLRSPLQRGGGTAFGPRPRNYGFKLNKKVKAVARKSALTLKASDKKIQVIENLEMAAPKTKDFINIITALGLDAKKSIIVLGDSNKNVYLSSRNFKGSDVVIASELNTYSIMNAQNVVLTEDSLGKLENLLSK